jgi:hypothetical protein
MLDKDGAGPCMTPFFFGLMVGPVRKEGLTSVLAQIKDS